MNKKVIIIGAGGAGLAVLSVMLKQEFDALILEKNSDVGGVWLSTRYPNLRIHSKSFNYRFIDFHPIKSVTDRATGVEVLNYMKDYATAKDLYKNIRFNTKVFKIVRKKNKKCEVYTVNTSNNEQQLFECDIVICALGFINAGTPHIPHFINEAKYQGTIVHSSEFNNSMLDDILSNQKKVIVLGAGRSAHDILILFEKLKNNITWLYTKSLWSLSFERLYNNNNKFSWNFLKILYGYYLILLKIRYVFPKYNSIMRWLQKPLVNTLLLNPLEPNTDIFQNRRALMGWQQFHYLQTIKSIKSNIEMLDEYAVKLTNGQILAADYIICATGYDRIANLPQIIIENENETNEEYDPKTKNLLYNMLDMDIPELAFFMTDGIYIQQLLSYSIAGQWLARFYKERLANNPDFLNRCSALMTKYQHQWYVPNRYLSNGSSYAHEKKNEYVLPLLLQDLGIGKKFAKALLHSSTNERIFNQVILKMIDKLF